MAFAQLDENGRIIQWSPDRLDGFDTEFSNGEYIDKNCIDGLDDFTIENGEAIFSPLPEKEIERLKKNLLDTDYIGNELMDSLIGAASMAEILETLASFSKEYGDQVKRRKEWRKRINELEE